MPAMIPRPIPCLLALLLAAGCEGKSGGPEPIDAGPKDAGLPGNIAATLACGDLECSATTSDARWGAEPCCLSDADDADACGLKADDPQFAYAGMITPVSEVLMDAKERGEPITNTHPVIECLMRNQPGVIDEGCPTERFLAPTADGGMAVSTDDGGVEDMGYKVLGCCRPDGRCGYVDPATDFGCVLISKSLVGQALGRSDRTCD